LETALLIVLIVISIILAVVVMMQEGKEQGLGAISGSSETYWSKNKGKSKEAMLKKLTAFLGVVYMIVCLLLASKLVK